MLLPVSKTLHTGAFVAFVTNVSVNCETWSARYWR